MSHFLTVAIIPKDRGKGISRSDIEGAIAELIDEYNENNNVPEYKKKCYCVGSLAKTALEKELNKLGKIREAEVDAVHKKWKSKKIDLLLGGGTEKEREKYHNELDAIIEAETKATKALLKKHPLRDKADPACEECSGKGIVTTTYNKSSKWDWYQIGGRFTGSFTPDYDPYKDPANLETCFTCSGTGVRPNGKKEFGEKWFKECNGCNECHGKGKSVKFNLNDHDGDIMDVEKIPKDFKPYAIVTPDGVWHERGEMGYFGMDSNRMPVDKWEKLVKSIFKKHKGYTAVCLDCHI